MKIAIIEQKDITIKIENNSIKLPSQNLPLALMDILILNHRTILSTNDILKLTKAKVSILIVSYNNSNLSIISSANTKNAQIKLAQYNAIEYNLEIAKYFIKSKIEHHNYQLQINGISKDIKPILKEIDNVDSIDSILGIEGNFARYYFKEYFALIPKEWHKSKRSKNPPLDPLNALLSFWYSLIYNIITIRLISYGFEPSIGYLHKPFRGHNALSSDILEIFRASINHTVMSIFKSNKLELDDFSHKGKGVYLTYKGRQKIWSEFISFVDIINPEIDKEIAKLRGVIDEKV